MLEPRTIQTNLSDHFERFNYKNRSFVPPARQKFHQNGHSDFVSVKVSISMKAIVEFVAFDDDVSNELTFLIRSV